MSEGNHNFISQIQKICKDCNIIHNEFNKRNKTSIHTQLNEKDKMNINYEKEFRDHLQKKLTVLNNRLKILQLKYSIYKKWYDRFNIMIIVISSILSIFEALRIELDDDIDEESNLSLFFNMVPIGISSTITCSAAIIKFKKYQEKMENMSYTREKVILAISKIKRVQESLWFNNNEDEFEATKLKYFQDVYDVYNDSISELDRHIKFTDLHKIKKCKESKKKTKDVNPIY